MTGQVTQGAQDNFGLKRVKALAASRGLGWPVELTCPQKPRARFCLSRLPPSTAPRPVANLRPSGLNTLRALRLCVRSVNVDDAGVSCHVGQRISYARARSSQRRRFNTVKFRSRLSPQRLDHVAATRLLGRLNVGRIRHVATDGERSTTCPATSPSSAESTSTGGSLALHPARMLPRLLSLHNRRDIPASKLW
jgi:hypothetical protein